ncbi:hypothetical protein [Maridesulfovibrio frigidus]|uniref:hypothetical protein n=1 Tax=Maridesulfovibrio frigidus TaxID=340956 RepID=UPI0006892D8A|nr:hypothetical protein [Maridesulfovibrio frigidus]
MIKLMLLTISIIIITVSSASGKEAYKPATAIVPIFPLSQPQMANTSPPVTKLERLNTSKFVGKLTGKVTVHYLKKMVAAHATITISSDQNDLTKSDYDFYVIPTEVSFLESEWELDGLKVKRSVTISGNTIYITDIINYKNNGGNSQIRTLVFNSDLSALTFLKTEFDDAKSNPATGQIIGRFTRTK